MLYHPFQTQTPYHLCYLVGHHQQRLSKSYLMGVGERVVLVHIGGCSTLKIRMVPSQPLVLATKEIVNDFVFALMNLFFKLSCFQLL